MSYESFRKANDAKELKAEQRKIEKQIDALNNWLCDHVNHPDFHKISRDRNALTVRVEQIKRELNTSEHCKGYQSQGMPEYKVPTTATGHRHF